MNVLSKTEELRRAALDYLWMHNSGWIEMAELGQPVIMVEGDGIRVKDSEGRTWIDPNGGYVSVNVGYGRTEIAEAAREQMRKLSFQPPGAATEPLIRVSEKIAEIAPGSMERVYPSTEARSLRRPRSRSPVPTTGATGSRAGTRSSAVDTPTTARRAAFLGWRGACQPTAPTTSRSIPA